MSDADKNQNDDNGLDPVEQALSIETPVVNDSVSKKKKPPIAKIGIAIFLGAMGFLVVSTFMGGDDAAQHTGGGTAQVRGGEIAAFRQAPATAAPSNPEAAALAEKKEAERAAEKAKEPGASYFKQDPFDSGATTPVVQETQNMPPPPPPPPSQMPAPQSVPSTPTVVNNGNGQEDPAITYARKVFSQATSSPRIGLTMPKPSDAQNQMVSQNGDAAAGQGRASAVMDADVAAGEIKYALLTSGLNSRVPQTPPRAVIHGGPLSGAVLLGVMENAENEYLVLRFKSMTIGKKTYPIEAIAVNPDMQDAGMADVVNSKMFQKTALQAGIGFIQAFGAAKLQEGTTITNSYGSNGGGSMTQTPVRTNKQTAMIAAGGAAQAIQPSIDQMVESIRPEVIIHPNKEMGILFLKPLFLQ